MPPTTVFSLFRRRCHLLSPPWSCGFPRDRASGEDTAHASGFLAPGIRSHGERARLDPRRIGRRCLLHPDHLHATDPGLLRLVRGPRVPAGGPDVLLLRGLGLLVARESDWLETGPVDLDDVRSPWLGPARSDFGRHGLLRHPARVPPLVVRSEHRFSGVGYRRTRRDEAW